MTWNTLVVNFIRFAHCVLNIETTQPIANLTSEVTKA